MAQSIKNIISYFICLLTVLAVSTHSGNSLNIFFSFNKKVSNKSTIYTCQYLKWIRSSYFSFLHLNKRVHFNLPSRSCTKSRYLCMCTSHPAGIHPWHGAARDPNGKQLVILFLPSMISGVVDWYHGHLMSRC